MLALRRVHDRFLITISLLLLLVGLCAVPIGCRAPSLPTPIDTNQVLTLTTDWKYSTYYSGQYTDANGRPRLIYSADLNTHLLMRVFDMEGHPLHDIPMKEAIDALDEINSCVLFAPDSIFVIEEHGPNYVIVDRSGTVVRKGSLAEALCPTPEDRYEVSGYFNGIGNFGRSLYLSASWWSRCGESGLDTTLTRIQNIQRHHLECARRCRMAKLSLGKDTALLAFGGCNIVPHLADTARESPGGMERVVLNGKLFLYSSYVSYVLQLDTGSLEVLHKIPLTYCKGTVGILPPPLTEEDFKKDNGNLRRATKAIIIGFTYDQPSKHYLAVVMHEVPEDTPEDEDGLDRPWSLIVLDSAFNKVAEHVVEGKRYWPAHLLSTEKGTYVRRNVPGRAGVTGPKIFHRLIVP